MAEFLKTAFGSAVTETFWLKVYSLAWRVVLCAALAIITIQAVKIIKKALKKAFKKVKVDDGIAGFLTSLICVGIYIVVGFIIAQSMGIDAASIVALLGSAGVTVGLAIQGSLANIAGGVLILILKPFKVGDYIIENSHSNEGTVIEIGLIYTKLNTIDNRTVILPNGTLANSSVVNVTQTPYRMIDLKLDIAYSADLQLAKDTIAKVLEFLFELFLFCSPVVSSSSKLSTILKSSLIFSPLLSKSFYHIIIKITRYFIYIPS